MLRTILYVSCFMILHQIVFTLQSSGWIPLSREEVFNRLNRSPSRRLVVNNHFDHHINSLDHELFKNNAITIAVPLNNIKIENENGANQVIGASKIVNDYTRLHDECNNFDNDCIGEQEKIVSATGMEVIQTQNGKESIESNERKAKDLKTINPKIAVENKLRFKPKTLQEVKGVQYLKDIRNEYADDEETRRTYQVTEDISDIAESEVQNMGYTNKPLTNSKNETRNITSTFLNILSKYHIGPKDDLPNYILSRRNRVDSPIMVIPIPLNIPPRLNSLNRFAVDPLLAVFLSNYGYYVPGLYGIRNKYRNLYGYLASNNLHNNKPFGSYKIFSDTDSSN